MDRANGAIVAMNSVPSSLSDSRVLVNGHTSISSVRGSTTCRGSRGLLGGKTGDLSGGSLN